MNYPALPSGSSFNFQISEGSSKLVIYFSGTGRSDGQFDFWKTGNQVDTHRLFLNNGRNHWYQDGIPGLGESVEETAVNIHLWARRIHAKEFYTVGQSMGAFGAILYGSKLGARVLAFGAETIVNLKGSHSIKLMQDRPQILYPDLHEVIANARKPIFGFAGERHPVDLYCMSEANGLRNYYPRSLMSVGHGIPSHLRNRERLVPLLQRFISNHRPPPMREDGEALMRHGFTEAFYNLHCQLADRRHAEAAETGRLALSLYDRADHAYYLTGSALLALKKETQARPLLEKALAMAPRFVDYRVAMARCLAMCGERDRAVSMLESVIADRPDSAVSFHELGRIHFARGNYHEALQAARHAADLKPTVAKFADLRKRSERRLAARSMPRRIYLSLVDAFLLRP
ncbi:tetratricopeptide repeat protein [Mesorhizobium yinganensis]|uniref:tetratricopeptide repeat protein n=1 Tax=Mesorhizobium yinganensis TaxID=3157707 RepID=UPI0032B71507